MNSFEIFRRSLSSMVFTAEEGKLVLDMVKARTRDAQPSDTAYNQQTGFEYIEKLKQEIGYFEFVEPTDRMQRVAYIRRDGKERPLDLHQPIQAQKELIRKFLLDLSNEPVQRMRRYVKMEGRSEVPMLALHVWEAGNKDAGTYEMALRCSSCGNSLHLTADTKENLQQMIDDFAGGNSPSHAVTCQRARIFNGREYTVL